MQHPFADAIAALSSRRSASRSRLHVTLLEHGGLMTASELARACGWDLWRLRAVILGDGRSFSHDRSPLALGQVVLYSTPHGDMVAQTEEGRREAQRLLLEPFWGRGRLR